jgi:hypothetical protein
MELAVDCDRESIAYQLDDGAPVKPKQDTKSEKLLWIGRALL